MRFKEGDVLVNYHYRIVYRFDPKSRLHIKETLSYCRLATFNECERYHEALKRVGERVFAKGKTYYNSNRVKKFEKFGSSTVEFAEMSQAFEWEDKDVIELRFTVDPDTLLFIHREADKSGTTDYTRILGLLLSKAAAESNWSEHENEEKRRELRFKRSMQELDSLELKLKDELKKTIQKIGRL